MLFAKESSSPTYTDYRTCSSKTSISSLNLTEDSPLPREITPQERRLRLLKKSISRLSLVTVETTQKLDLVRVYKARVVSSYNPPATEPDLLSIPAGANVTVFGTKLWAKSTIDAVKPTDEVEEILPDIDVGDGWCNAETESGESGYFPITCMLF
jgi:hypothetical protein